MVETSINLFDLIVLLVVGLSALLSFFRGFAREILSLGAWLGAGIITLYTFPIVSEWLEPQVKNQAVASGFASLGVFVVSLIAISLLLRTFFKFIKPGSEVGPLDNIVGLFFGAARGLLLVAIGYFMLSVVKEEDDYPEWVKQSQSRPYIAKMSTWIAEAAPDYMNALKEPATDLEQPVEEAQHKAKKHAQKVVTKVKDEADDAVDAVPSFEELQRRVRAENTRD